MSAPEGFTGNWCKPTTYSKIRWVIFQPQKSASTIYKDMGFSLHQNLGQTNHLRNCNGQVLDVHSLQVFTKYNVFTTIDSLSVLNTLNSTLLILFITDWHSTGQAKLKVPTDRAVTSMILFQAIILISEPSTAGVSINRYNSRTLL